MMKLAVIGAGYWGKNLIRNFDALGALAAICDLNPETIKEFDNLYPQVPKTDDFKSLLNDPTIDALAVASPAEVH